MRKKGKSLNFCEREGGWDGGGGGGEAGKTLCVHDFPEPVGWMMAKNVYNA